MKIAIIAAMEEETSILKSKINNPRIEAHSGFEFFVGEIQGCDIVLLQSGIGKVAAASATTLLLNHYHVDAVINTGSAGALARQLDIGDVVVSSSVFYHDVDLTAFGYPLGQMSGCPLMFQADSTYCQLAIKHIEKNNVKAIEGIIGSGDSFINGDESINRIKTAFPDIVAVDMEAAAIGHVCWMFNTPFVVVRAISDNGDDHSAMDFDEFLILASNQSSLIVESMLTELGQVR